MTFIQDLNVQLLELGFPLARARENSIEQMVEYNRNHTRIICTGDQPDDWKPCPNGAQHPKGFCPHFHSDLCLHPLTLTAIPQYRPIHTLKVPIPCPSPPTTNSATPGSFAPTPLNPSSTNT